MPNGLDGPYRASSVSPATTVGRANGRSMRALMNRWLGNRSRTSTQATIVPITAPMADTTSAAPSVIPSARRATGLVTDSQKLAGLCDTALTVTAASGMRTMTLRYRIDSPRPSPYGRRPAPTRGRAGRAGAGAGAGGARAGGREGGGGG